MPTYTYQCQKCAHMVDASRKIVDRDIPPESCENCRNVEFKRIQHPVGVVLKGGGWHNDDYSKRGPRKN